MFTYLCISCVYIRDTEGHALPRNPLLKCYDRVSTDHKAEKKIIIAIEEAWGCSQAMCEAIAARPGNSEAESRSRTCVS